MAQLDALVTLIREVLGEGALGAYLHGSAVAGGLRPTSDTDVLVVTARPLGDDERRRLVRGVMAVSGRRAAAGPDRPVELTVVVQRDVRPWRYPPVADFQYGEWNRDDYERGVLPARETTPDLAPLLTMTLHGDRPLFGPPPAALLDAVPHEDLVRAIVAGIPGLLADLEHDTRNVVLTFARIWTTVETGVIRPKDAAADWAPERLPPSEQPVLRRARDSYLAGDHGSFDDLRDDVTPHVDTLIARIRAALAGRGIAGV
jgi:predicted nucleotidyltransferase